MKQMTITACRFKRNTIKDPWESGVMINEDKLMIDTENQPVPYPVYNYEIMPEYGRMILTLL